MILTLNSQKDAYEEAEPNCDPQEQLDRNTEEGSPQC